MKRGSRHPDRDAAIEVLVRHLTVAQTAALEWSHVEECGICLVLRLGSCFIRLSAEESRVLRRHGLRQRGRVVGRLGTRGVRAVLDRQRRRRWESAASQRRTLAFEPAGRKSP